MAGRLGRQRRANGVGCRATRISARLLPESLEVAERAAEALGVTRDAYLDMLLAQERTRLDETGRPTWWTAPVAEDQEELPLSQSA